MLQKMIPIKLIPPGGILVMVVRVTPVEYFTPEMRN